MLEVRARHWLLVIGLALVLHGALFLYGRFDRPAEPPEQLFGMEIRLTATQGSPDGEPDPVVQEPEPEPEPEPVPTPAEVEQQLGLEDVPEREDEEPSADEQVAGDPEAEQNYLSWLNEQLQRYREYPRQAQMRRMEGTVEVVFTIETDGRITNARIASSSGHTLLDDAVLRLLERLSPLQKAPETRLEDRRLPVEYRLR